MKTETMYDFKKGNIVSLDQIYHIQGLARGDWWKRTGGDVRPGDLLDLGEELEITRDITITITVDE